MTRRVVTTATLAVALVALSVSVAVADELDDYIDRSADASYAGQQATWCTFSGETEFFIVSVENAGSVLMVEAAGSSQMLSEGRVSTDGSGVALADWSSAEMADRYVSGGVVAEVRLGREVAVLTINEDGQLRARIWFDEETGATLGSEVYGAGEELYRLTWMIDFNPNPRRIYTALGEQESTYDVVVRADAGSAPQSLAGYELVDTYAGPDGSVHAFYSDGLFSFSLFVISGEGASGPFVDAETMTVDSGSYRWILTPSDLWVQWSGDGQTYVLAGDLPPDHLEVVLSGLPSPSRGNILSRIWNGLFG